MKINKTTISQAQNLQFITVREFGDYVIITLPLDMSLEISGDHIHIRKVKYMGR